VYTADVDTMSDHPQSISVVRRCLRVDLGLTRIELAKFLGVSEATVVRWESDDSMSEPKGLQAVIFSALTDAVGRRPNDEIAKLVRTSGRNHRDALRTLLDTSD
jgi:transcriptional regulator with XRE-family HTH domain